MADSQAQNIEFNFLLYKYILHEIFIYDIPFHLRLPRAFCGNIKFEKKRENSKYLSLYCCMEAEYDGGGGRCWNSGYKSPNEVFPLPHCRLPHLPKSVH